MTGVAYNKPILINLDGWKYLTFLEANVLRNELTRQIEEHRKETTKRLRMRNNSKVRVKKDQ